MTTILVPPETATALASTRGAEADRRWFRRVLLAAVVVKLIAMIARYYVIYVVYDGAADVGSYVESGERIAGQLRSGVLPVEATETGTSFMEFVVGVIFSVLGAHVIPAFVVLTFMSLVGLVLFSRAFVMAVPEGDHRRFTLLVLFLPTLLFWTSSIGKEAFITLGLGVAAYGAARVFRKVRYGYPVLAGGLLMTFMVRPHIGALVAVAFAAGFLVRPATVGQRRGWMGWMVGLALAGVLAVGLAGSLDQLLPVDEDGEGSVFEQVTAVTEDRTSKGGSAFENRPVTGLRDIPEAVITVPFRPFPWEVTGNLQAMVAGLEGLALLGLVVASWRRLRHLPRTALRTPFVTMATLYTAGFIVAFSAVGNFGILARQRAQLLPFLVVLLCLPRGDAPESPRRSVTLTAR